MSRDLRVTLVNLPLVIQEKDPHTGIVYMPLMLATLSAYLKDSGFDIQVVDAFGEDPWHFSEDSGLLVQGLPIQAIPERIRRDADAVLLYFGNVSNYLGVRRIAAMLRERMPDTTLILCENAQAVTAFSLRHDAENLLEQGFDLLLYGDVERSAVEALRSLREGRPFPETDGFIFRRTDGSLHAGKGIPLIPDLDALPFPDWISFPLSRYWSLGYAHGPFQGPYLPLMTSRGCPVRCRFCIIPGTNNQRWRARSPVNVVDEMEMLQQRFGVSDFHLEDVNPTVNDSRIRELCKEIGRRGLKVTWKIVSGTKIETMKPETIPLMARAGCDFIGFSPETGSPELLKKINKPFNHELALELVRLMRRHGIRSQACFVLGFPGETPADVKKTKRYIRRLIFAGVDEIAQFIVTPIPGSAIADAFSGYRDYSELTFSPRWRQDYPKLHRRRQRQYAAFFFWKMVRQPRRLLRNAINVLRGKFETKMEQALFRVTLWRLRRWWHQPRAVSRQPSAISTDLRHDKFQISNPRSDIRDLGSSS